MKNTQIKRVDNQLNKYGYISRNWCLRRWITRLSAIIYDLKKKGYQFEIERRNNDYVYKLK